MSGCWIKVTKLDFVYEHASTKQPSLMRDLYLFLLLHLAGDRFMPRYKGGMWDGRVPLIQQTGRFHIGLIRYIYGLQKDFDNQITISTWQSMCKQPELTQTFDMIIVDETHGVKASVVRSVAENAINAHIRIGCTGTMPESKGAIYAIEGALGPV